MKRKIAFISEHASPLAALGGVDSGGQNVYVAQLAKQLSALGYDIDVFTRWDDKRLPEVIEWSAGVRIINVKAGPIATVKKEDLLQHMDEFTKNMKKFIAREDSSYKLIHAHFFMSGLVASNLKKELNIPYVITFHALGKIRQQFQGKNDKFPPERTEIEELVTQNADLIVAECPQDREDLIERYSADPAKIVMIPCGFNREEFFPIDKLIARNVINANPDERIILQLGRMVPRKGVDDVVRSMGRLIYIHKVKARLIIVGGESDEPDPTITTEIGRLMELAKQERVEQYITFAGRKTRDQLKYYYSAADVFVTTPWYEPFGITPLESMACGTPVIGSKVGGIKYSVRDGKTGYLVSPKKPEEIAEKVAELLTNQKLLTFFKENALQRVHSLFTWSKVANSMADAYENILTSNSFETENTLALIENGFVRAVETFSISKELLRIPILDAANTIARSLLNGNTLLVCGNGGSATDAQHMVGELVGRFVIEGREALPAIALTADTSIITAYANDYSFNKVFSRQVEAYGRPGDVLVGISTSGYSKNVIEAFNTANKYDLTTIALTGKNGGKLRELADISIVVPSQITSHIQEVHINIIHTICEIVEKQIVAYRKEEMIAQNNLIQSLNGKSRSYLSSTIKPQMYKNSLKLNY